MLLATNAYSALPLPSHFSPPTLQPSQLDLCLPITLFKQNNSNLICPYSHHLTCSFHEPFIHHTFLHSTFTLYLQRGYFKCPSVNHFCF